VTIGGLSFARETLEPGWRRSSHVKPAAGGESCQRRHVKIFVSGRQRIRMDDGTEMGLVRATSPSSTRGMTAGSWVTNRTCSSNSPRRRERNDRGARSGASNQQPGAFRFMIGDNPDAGIV
jgi:hypothetical protein